MTDAWRTYDEVADTYGGVRPTYPSEIFDAIHEYHRHRPGAVIEVGTGTGQATVELVRRGWRVVAVEPGAELTQLARLALRDQPVTVECALFEELPVPDEAFDLIAAATSWHWVDTDVGYAKAARILKDGGTFAAWWNAHVPDSPDPRWVPIRRTYERVAPELARLPRLTPDRHNYNPRQELEDSGLFTDVDERTYTFERNYTGEEFVALTETYASHRHLSNDVRERLHEALRTTVATVLDGVVTKPYEAYLVLGRKLDASLDE